MKLGKTPEEGAGGLRRVRRLHRQPHAGEVRAAEPVPARRGRDARRRSTARCSAGAWRWARSPCTTWRATTSAGRSASAATRSARTWCTRRSPTASASRALRAEDRQGLVPLRAGQAASRSPIRKSRQLIDTYRKRDRRQAAADPGRGDRRALHLRARQRGRAHPRGRHRAARLRHRHGLPHRLRLPALPRRADVLRRQRRAATRCWRRSRNSRTDTRARNGSRRRCS